MAETRRLVEAVFRMERARLIAGLARFVRSIDLAEELAQDALVAALEEWPTAGVPTRPGAWLMTVAKRGAVDRARRAAMQARKHAEIAVGMEEADGSAIERAEAKMDDDIGDELLGLVFAACHPILPAQARAALTLRLVAGLTTAEIARAFLTVEATVAQRIVRAKRAIAKAGLRFEVPRGPERGSRLPSVLEVIYLVFNEGYAATAGADLTRPDLCNEARRLGRVLVGLMPEEPEVLGLLALMELQASRLAARAAPDGSPITLPEQNRAKWDRLAIDRGLAHLARVEALGGENGVYALQAALAACHARALKAEDTDWARIAGLYDRLQRVIPTPVVALNRAIAHGMAFGPETGLKLVDPLVRSGLLRHYAPLHAAIGDLLLRLQRLDEARLHLERAARMSRNEGERRFLLARAAACAGDSIERPHDRSSSPAGKPAGLHGHCEARAPADNAGEALSPGPLPNAR